jgi:hypothetical protein
MPGVTVVVAYRLSAVWRTYDLDREAAWPPDPQGLG